MSEQFGDEVYDDTFFDSDDSGLGGGDDDWSPSIGAKEMHDIENARVESLQYFQIFGKNRMGVSKPSDNTSELGTFNRNFESTRISEKDSKIKPRQKLAEFHRNLIDTKEIERKEKLAKFHRNLFHTNAQQEKDKKSTRLGRGTHSIDLFPW